MSRIYFTTNEPRSPAMDHLERLAADFGIPRRQGESDQDFTRRCRDYARRLGPVTFTVSGIQAALMRIDGARSVEVIPQSQTLGDVVIEIVVDAPAPRDYLADMIRGIMEQITPAGIAYEVVVFEASRGIHQPILTVTGPV